MKKIRFIALLFFCAVLTFGALAAEYTFVYDGAQLLTDIERETLETDFDAILQESGLLCVVVTQYGSENMLSALPDYAKDAADMILLDIDMQARTFNLYQYNRDEGEAAFQLSNRESDDILDTVLIDMADGEYAKAAQVFGSLSAEYFSNADPFVPGSDGYGEYGYTDYTDGNDAGKPNYGDYGHMYDEDEQSVGGRLLDALPMSAFIGLVVSVISVICVYGRYKTKQHGAVYPLEKYTALDLTQQDDRFVNKTVTVAVIQNSTNSTSHRGGGFGGGHSGGGRSGGGGHAGGRSF